MPARRYFLPSRTWRRMGHAAGRDEDGNTLVETAIGISLFLMVLIAIIEVGLALYTYNYISDAAREGSRWAIVRGASCSINTPGLDHCNALPTDISNYVQSIAYPGIVSSNMTVTTKWFQPSSTRPTSWSACTATPSNPCNQQGYQVQVTVTYPFSLNIPFWQNASVTVGSTSAMVISQ